jgi:predicted porin
MKKTLIALAVLAASGASFAQVTITGNLTMGYQADHRGVSKTDASGLGVDTAEIIFKASEDLGGGMKASAQLGLDSVTRAAGLGGHDAVLAVSGGFGALTLATAKGADYLSGGVAKVGGTGMDGKVFSVRTSADSIAYAMPFGPVTVSLTHAEPANTLGLGAGAAGAQGTYTVTNFEGTVSAATENQRSNRLAAKYAAGALVVDGGYAVYDQSGTTGGNDKSQIRAAVSYNLGVAQIGGGMVVNSKVVGTRTDALVSVAFPMGALTLGADWASRTTADYAAAVPDKNGTMTGYGLSASYALSKRTSASLSYTNFKQTLDATENSTSTAVLLSHSF